MIVIKPIHPELEEPLREILRVTPSSALMGNLKELLGPRCLGS